MREAQWVAATDPQAMLAFLRDGGRLSERKARLFAVACCRGIWYRFKHECSRTAIEVAERYADGQATEEELLAASRAADGVRIWGGYAVEAAFAAVNHDVRAVQYAASREFAPSPSSRLARNAQHVALLRDIFGPLPFRRPSIDPAWLAWNEGTVVRLARAVYDGRELPSGHLDRQRLAVLADALEEAGCTDQEVLGHLRGPGPHTRGCWAVDILTGRD